MGKKKSESAVSECYSSVVPPAKLDRIVIDIRGKKLELSDEEARSLMRVLKDLFGDGWTTVTPWITPWYVPSYPHWVVTPQAPNTFTTITCTTETT